MRTKKLAASLLRVLAVLLLAAAFSALDWYPAFKDLGRLRRERSDLVRKIRDHGAAAASFKFPDEKENSLLAAADAELGRALPLAESDEHWLGSARTELLQREKGLADLILFFSAKEKMGPGAPGLTAWLKLQTGQIGQGFQAADPRQSYPWRGIFPPMPAGGGLLACRPLGIALDARLPEILGFINRISWSGARLEIVRLRLEPAGASARAWLVCRGSFRAPETSAWLVEPGNGDGEEMLLIDPDSPLLLQRIDPFLAPRVEKRELPPAPSKRGDAVGSPW
jgi:hypothetical protein